MEKFVKGSVIVFPFLYTDLLNFKKRPCLVLSEEMGDDILLYQITSKNSIKDQFVIELNKSELDCQELMVDSYIRTNMLFTANKITKVICKLSNLVVDKLIK